MNTSLSLIRSYVGFDRYPISSCTLDGIPTDISIEGVNPEESFKSSAPNGKEGRSWIVIHGFVGIIPMTAKVMIDGMNTEGLSVSALGQKNAVCQRIPDGQECNALTINDLIPFVLGTCSTVKEVAVELRDTFVWDGSGKNNPPSLKSFTFMDSTGTQLFLEYIDGKPVFNLFNDSPGILTENKRADWDEKVQNGFIEKYASPLHRYAYLIRIFKNMKIRKNKEVKSTAWKIMDEVSIKFEDGWMLIHDGKIEQCYNQYTVVFDHVKRRIFWKDVRDEVRKIDLRKWSLLQNEAIIFRKQPS